MDPIAAAVLSSWKLDWRTLCLLLAFGIIYFRGWRRIHRELPHKYTLGKLAVFAGGLLTLLVALASPIDAFGEMLLSAHMIQHLLLIMVAPPLLLLAQPVLPLLRGLPRWIFKDVLGPFLGWQELREVGRALVHPITCWWALSAVIVGWHLPRSYELALHSQAWHQAEHAFFFWAAILFWWPVIEVWPSHSFWPRWAMIPYLVLADLVNTGLSAVLSFSDHVLYPTYEIAPRLWGISAIGDQATAGAIMWVPGSIALLLPALTLGMKALERRPVRPIRSVARVAAPRVSAKAARDLLRVPILGPILRSRHFRRCIQTGMLLLAVAIAIDGFSGPRVAALNLAGVLPWTYWRGLAVIALLMAGNLFCLACPFTLPRDLARKFVRPRYRSPRALRSKSIAAGLLATYLWAYEAFALSDSPVATAWIIVGYFAAAFAIDTAFRGASFCKYVCPIGQFHFVHSLISPLQVTVRQPAVCDSCNTHDCIRGNVQQRGCEMDLFQPRKIGNFDCTFCLDCVQACPTENVTILRVLQRRLYSRTARSSGIGRLRARPDVAALALILVFGAFINAAGMTEPVMMWMHHLHAVGQASLGVSSLGADRVPALCHWRSSPSRDFGRRLRLDQSALGASERRLEGTDLRFCAGSGSCRLQHVARTLLEPPGRGMERTDSGRRQIFFVVRGHLCASVNAGLDAFAPTSLPGLRTPAHSFHCMACGSRSYFGRTIRPAAPWAVLAGALYWAGVWIVFQPMQMRGTMMMR